MSACKGCVGKASSILNLNVRSGDRLTSHPPIWTPWSDLEWRQRHKFLSCVHISPSLPSGRLYWRISAYDTTSSLLVLWLPTNGRSKFSSGRNIWNFAFWWWHPWAHLLCSVCRCFLLRAVKGIESPTFVMYSSQECVEIYLQVSCILFVAWYLGSCQGWK
jgi:hypothetical protein